MDMDWNAGAARYEKELLTNVIPFWEKHGIDRECGGFFTMLDRDGSVYDTSKYLWLQWRNVYMFATLYKSEYGAGREDWLRIARDGFDWLVAHGRLPDGRYYFQLNRRGEPAMAPYSIFSDCFAAMGSAALFKATGDPRHRAEAESAMASYVRRIPNPKGEWEKTLPGKGQRRALGAYMILVNLAAVMSECLGVDRYEAEARDAVMRVMNDFWHPRYRVILENVNEDGSFDLESCEGRFVTPGHGLESMWFILAYARERGDRAQAARAAEYVDGLFRFGTDKEYGGLYYFMDVLGKPHLELQHDMKLWWVHNEASLAALHAYEATGERRFLEHFRTVEQWAWSHFPDPEYGEWYAYLNRRGEPASRMKGGKWKGCFHLPRYLLVGARRMKALAARKESGTPVLAAANARAK